MNRRRSDPKPSPTPERTSPFPTADQIAARAHELFVSGGRRLADVANHWRTAEQELLDAAARRTLERVGDRRG